MNINLSEVNDHQMILVGDRLLSKADVLKDLDSIKNDKSLKDDIWTTLSYSPNLDAREIIENAFESYCLGMYDSWYEDILYCIEDKDVNEVQVILNRILKRNGNNISYEKHKKINIDI